MVWSNMVTKMIQTKMKQLYNQRSRIVHGVSKLKDLNSETIEDLQNFTRLAILYLIYLRKNGKQSILNLLDEVVFDPYGENIQGLKKKTQSYFAGCIDFDPLGWTKYKVGMRVEGIVIAIYSFGALVGIEDGVVGLLHISNMSFKDILTLYGNYSSTFPGDLL